MNNIFLINIFLVFEDNQITVVSKNYISGRIIHLKEN